MNLDYIRDNLEQVNNRIADAAYRSGKNPSDVTLVAVSKTVNVPFIKEALSHGVINFGENRVQDLKSKITNVPEAKWHMIGRLQSNKVKDIVGKVALIHSLDRWKLAETLDIRGEYLNISVPTLLQVNITQEKQKAGVSIEDVQTFLDSVGQLKTVKIYGFMTMARLSEEPEEARPIFRQLFQLREQLKRVHFKNVELKYLSMGMSQDFEVAIEEGSNMVRVGSLIFGQDNQ